LEKRILSLAYAAVACSIYGNDIGKTDTIFAIEKVFLINIFPIYESLDVWFVLIIFGKE
jgi:hypothetical protein